MKIGKVNSERELEPYKDTLFWELAGKPFFHSSVYYWTKILDKKYYSHSNEFIVKYQSGGKLAGYTSKQAFIAPGSEIIKEILSGKDDYLVELKSFKKILKKNTSDFQKLLGKRKFDFKLMEDLFTLHAMALQLIFSFDFAMTDQIKSLTRNNHEVYKCFLSKSAPNERSFLEEENQSFDKIISRVKYKNLPYSQAKQNKEISKLVIGHAKRYIWIENSYAGSKRLTLDHFWARLEKRLTESESIDNINKKFCKLPRGLNLLAKVTSVVFDIRDLRKKLMMIGVQLMDNLLVDLSGEVGVDYDKLTWLTAHEVKELIEGRLKIEDRSFRDGYRYGKLKDGMLYDTNANFYHKVEKIHRVESADSVKGIVASMGKVTGVCKIVLHYSDMEKVKEGNILICSMTRPDMLPAMRRASAFVTNEGGITCHAAIIAREMKKPCIINTKIATQVLKDGDMVEVDAERGVVTVIEKAK